MLEQAAIRLLSQREHSRLELGRKLAGQAEDADQLDRLLDELAEQGLQSDARFAEQYLHSRKNRGYGPVRIRMELQERGVEATLVASVVDAEEHDWWGLLKQVRQSKFGHQLPIDFKQQAKQARFLEYRGFPGEWVRELIWQHS